MAACYLALVHYPVLDKQGKTVASSVTTLDVHDLGRLARTYHLAGVYIVTPLETMVYLVRRMLHFWHEGGGVQWKPTRHHALERVQVARTLEDCLAEVAAVHGAPARVIATSARPGAEALGWDTVGGWIRQDGPPMVVLLGTGYGLAPEALQLAHYRLPALRADSDYNHLTVRAAAAIMVDRLIGEWTASGAPAAQRISDNPQLDERMKTCWEGEKHASGNSQT